MASIEGKPKIINETYNRRFNKMENNEDKLKEQISELDRRFEMLLRILQRQFPDMQDLRYI